jgi:hypothetical protein
MTPLEKEIEWRLRNMVQWFGGYCLKWVCPGWTGVPDRIVLLPGGRVVFVELKRPAGGRLSKMQLWWMKKLQELGFRHYVIYNHEDLAAFKEKELTK